MSKSLLEKVRSSNTLGKAWSAVRKNGRISKSRETREEVAAFEDKAFEKLNRIQRQLNTLKFKFRPAKGKKIPKKKKHKFRPLVIAPIESRIVQRAVHEVLIDVPSLQQFIKTPFSFGGIRKENPVDLASVPAAIQCALDAIANGSIYVVRSDISDFFTKVPKSEVTNVIDSAVNEPGFIQLFVAAIEVELENMAQLRQHASAFPIEDIGIAQGNSLSPLLGNIFLADFDRELNRSSDIRCIRYIDDFLILAPSKSLANNQFAKAESILKRMGLTLSNEKTIRSDAIHGFTFLGIELINGLIRPSKESRDGLIATVADVLKEGKAAFTSANSANPFTRRFSLVGTLLRAQSAIQGWGKHYWFCNDANCLSVLDAQIDNLIDDYRNAYATFRSKLTAPEKRRLLGIETLAQMDRSNHFIWPQINPLSKSSRRTAQTTEGS